MTRDLFAPQTDCRDLSNSEEDSWTITLSVKVKESVPEDLPLACQVMLLQRSFSMAFVLLFRKPVNKPAAQNEAKKQCFLHIAQPLNLNNVCLLRSSPEGHPTGPFGTERRGAVSEHIELSRHSGVALLIERRSNGNTPRIYAMIPDPN